MKPENNEQNNGIAKMVQPNGSALNAGGTPGNKGGPGRTPNELRRMARESLPKAIERADKIIEDKKATNADIVRAGEFLKGIGVPAQTETLIANETLVRVVCNVGKKYVSADDWEKFATEVYDAVRDES